MALENVIDLILTILVTGALGALLWKRLDRLETLRDEFDKFRVEIRDEFGKFRVEMRDEFARVESSLRGDLARFETATHSDFDRIREEMAVMRSDLTHVALAVGAARPKPMEG